jgi:hypothetical protein
MTRTLIAGVATAAATAALLAVPTAAQAAPGGITWSNTSTRTSVKYTTGTGIIRARQMCESSSGQTNWYVYGNWAGRNVWSTTPACTYVVSRSYQTSNPV